MSIKVVLCLCLLAVTGAGQTTHPSKKAPSKVRPLSPAFVCPDPEAQKACESYKELLKAKDEGLPSHGYICFRKNEDQFFVISFSRPYFPKRWDKEQREWLVPDNATDSGHGDALAYKDGIEDSSVMPSLHFSGNWYAFSAGFFSFTSEKIDFADVDKDDHDVGVVIDNNQLMIGHKYRNVSAKTVIYSLTIQRSTGRFSETFREEAEKTPSIENIGRCVFVQ